MLPQRKRGGLHERAGGNEDLVLHLLDGLARHGLDREDRVPLRVGEVVFEADLDRAGHFPHLGFDDSFGCVECGKSCQW